MMFSGRWEISDRVNGCAHYRSGLQSNIRDYVKQHAGWSHIARQHVDVYHKVVKVPYGKGRYVYFPEGE